MIFIDDRKDLRFDITAKNRCHYNMMATLIGVKDKSANERKKILNERGLHDDLHLTQTMVDLFPSLDLVRSRAIDAAHSEYQGLAKIMFLLIFQDPGLLTKAGLTLASNSFRVFPLPPRFPKFQSLRHLKSWRIGELARGIACLPVLLYSFLKDDHIKIRYHAPIRSQASKYFRSTQDFARSLDTFSISELIVIAAHLFSRSVLVCCSEVGSMSGVSDLRSKVFKGRRAIQFLYEVYIQAGNEDVVRSVLGSGEDLAVNEAVQAGPGDKRKRYPKAGLRISNPTWRHDDAVSLMSASSVGTTRQRERQAHPLASKLGLPNLHIGLHFVETAEEYGWLYMVFTLLGEDFHRYAFLGVFPVAPLEVMLSMCSQLMI